MSCFLSATGAGAQAPTPPKRRPFARAGTPAKLERIRLFDVEHLKGEITLDPAKKEIRGTATLTLRPLVAGLKTVTLDCGADLKVSRVAVGSKVCKYEQKGDKLITTLDPAPPASQPIDLAITYAGTPEKGVEFIKPGAEHPGRADCVWTMGEPEEARFWIPCFDYPNDKFTSEMVVTVPRPLSVVSNGTLVGTIDNPDGTRTFDWKMDQPLTTYLLSVDAADFNVYHDKLGNLPVDYYVLKEVNEETARRVLGKTPRMIEFFNRVIGTPYGYPKYAQICMPEFGGGMEHTSATTLTDTILVDPIATLERDADSLVAHELAHQWFGDLLTCRDWSNLWLNEGFASYFDPLFTQYDRGEDAFRIQMAEVLGGYLGSDSQYRRPITETRYEDPWGMFDPVTYDKGACVLHALRGLVGEDAWWKGIQLYVKTHKDQVVSTSDFQADMETASGRDLGWFFDQWVHKAGHPELAARWRYEPDDKTLRLTVEQTQTVDAATPLFRLPTTVEVTDDAGPRLVAIVIDGKSQEFVIPAATRPRMVRIDPLGWLPKTLTFDKPLDEWIYQLGHSRDVLGRLEAARILADKFKGEKAAIDALVAAWPLEKHPPARVALVQRLAALGEPGRPALLEAAKDADAKVRVAAITGLARLKFDPALETLFRAVFANTGEARGARREALSSLIKAKVKDADELIATGLKDSAGNHALARTALQALLDQGGGKAREAAVIYSRAGQPQALRNVAVGKLATLAKDDPALESLLLDLLDDDADSRFQTTLIFTVAGSGLTSALPKLEKLVGKVNGPIRARLQSQIDELKKQTVAAKPAADANAEQVAELERQARELELQAKELRNRAEGIKLQLERASLVPAAK
jgi:aminopeptidase N